MANRMVLNETSYFGQGGIGVIPEEVKRRGFQKALVVTDPNLIKFQVATKVTKILDDAGLAYEIFDDVKANPAIENVKAGVAAFQKAKADYIIAIGGGSPQDTAKAIGIIINNPDFADVRSLEGVADTKNKSVPVIAIPTTAGTAAEVTINSVITDVENKRKFVCVDVNDIPVLAIVDPDMMASMPASLAASTGMDALTHAIEGYTTKGAWELSDALCLKSIEMIGRSLRASVLDQDMTAKNDMGVAQYVAGMAFSNVGLGLVHGMAHPLGAYYDTPHGVANALLLPYVMEFNKDYTGDKYKYIAKALGVKDVDSMTPEQYKDAAVQAVFQLSKDLNIPQKLQQLDIPEQDLESLAQSAFEDVCTPGNPREATKEEILALYQKAYR